MGGNIKASDYALDPDEQPSKITPKMVYRILRMMAIDRHHIMQLFRQTHGLKEYKFEDILKEIAEDFNIPLKKLQDVNFHRFP